MPVIELVRLEDSSKYGMFGVLKVQKEVFCVTLEPPQRMNAPNVSCIPAKQYILGRYGSPTYGMTFQVLNVPGRSAVLFHAGNRVKDTEGCIILAQHFGKLHGDRAVLNSGATFAAFMKMFEGFELAHLTIKEVF